MTTWMKLRKMKMKVLMMMKIEDMAHTGGCVGSQGVDVVPLRGKDVKIF